MIHKYSIGHLNIVIDVNSGSVHLFDELSFEMIDLYEQMSLNEIVKVNCINKKYDYKDIEQCYNEITELKKSGVLFSNDSFQAVSNELTRDNIIVKALCLHIAHDCNLMCEYCFAGTGEYSGDRALMDAKTGRQAIDFLIQNSGNRTNLEVDFFGGEPTLNFKVVEDIVLYGREMERKHNKKFRFTLTTNGVLLDDHIMDFANKHMQNVVLSIDGRKETNDKMRKNKNGKGSYDKIAKNLKKFVDSRNGENYYVRGTYTNQNLDFSKDVFHLDELGFKQISIEPVVASENEYYSIKKEHLDYLFGQYDIIADEIVNRINGEEKNEPFHFFHFKIDLSGGSCAIKRISGCGAGVEYMAVTPEGYLYPCHQFVGKEGFKMGSVYSGIDRLDLVSKFNKISVYSKNECRDCWAKFYCSGGCAANSYSFSGNINDVYEMGCMLQKKRIECGIYIEIIKRTNISIDTDSNLKHW